jgi:hypothetical protein
MESHKRSLKKKYEMSQDKKSPSKDSEALKAVDRIYHEWDAALEKNDVEALMALYHDDAILESPLIPHLAEGKKGICQGATEIRKLIELVSQRKPMKRKYYRNRYFTDGKILIWEYPRLSPQGDQMDFVEVMEIIEGKIKHHRVYWGWYGFDVLKKEEYHR